MEQEVLPPKFQQAKWSRKERARSPWTPGGGEGGASKRAVDCDGDPSILEKNCIKKGIHDGTQTGSKETVACGAGRVLERGAEVLPGEGGSLPSVSAPAESGPLLGGSPLLRANGSFSVLVVKGNLRHRIDLLGVELLPRQLDETQELLRRLVRSELPPEVAADSSAKLQEACPERPSWARGAFVFLNRYHLLVAPDLLGRAGVTLQSKHVVVSDIFKPLVLRLLGAKPQGPGREAFLRRRAGQIEKDDTISASCHVLHLDGCARRVGDAVFAGNSSSSSSHGTHCEEAVLRAVAQSQGFDCQPPDRPSWGRGGVFYLSPPYAAEVMAAPDRGSRVGPEDVIVDPINRSAVLAVIARLSLKVLRESLLFKPAPTPATSPDPDLLFEPAPTPATSPDPDPALWKAFCEPGFSLGAELAMHRSVDIELVEYLTAPITVQQMEPEKWREAWEFACHENDWLLEAREDRHGWSWPYCLLCSDWATPLHLDSRSCRSKRERHMACQPDDSVGPLLSEILRSLEAVGQNRFQ